MKTSLLTLLIFGLSSLGFTQCEDFEISTSLYHPTCFGFTDGIVTVFPTGGSDPYDVEITDEDGFMLNADGSTTANLLPNGWYYIWVIDSEGCIIEDSVELVNPNVINVDDYTIVDHSGEGECDGSITINSVSGYDMEWLAFFWAPGSAESMNGYGENIYPTACPEVIVLTINDTSGCSGFFDFTVGGETTSFSENTPDENIRVFADMDSWTVLNSVENSENQLEIYVFDLLGKQIYTSKLTTGSNVFQLSQRGAFIYQIYDGVELIKKGKVVKNPN